MELSQTLLGFDLLGQSRLDSPAMLQARKMTPVDYLKMSHMQQYRRLLTVDELYALLAKDSQTS